MGVVFLCALTIVYFVIRPAERELRSSSRFGSLGAKLITADNRPNWVKALLREVPITKVTSVDLSGTEVTDVELSHLEGFPKLGGLILDDTKIGDAGVQYIGRATGLVQLGMARTRVTNLRLDGLTRLQSLDLSGNRLTTLSLGRMVNLTSLNLRSTNIAELGLSSLEGLSELKSLDLRDTKISDANLGSLRGLSNLNTLYLYNTSVTDRGVKTLLLSNPKLAVKR